MKPIAITVAELCALVRIGKTTAHKLINAQEVCSFKIGRKTLITMESVEILLERAISDRSSR